MQGFECRICCWLLVVQGLNEGCLIAFREVRYLLAILMEYCDLLELFVVQCCLKGGSCCNPRSCVPEEIECLKAWDSRGKNVF